LVHIFVCHCVLPLGAVCTISLRSSSLGGGREKGREWEVGGRNDPNSVCTYE
jgi:hypothetical protein